MLTTFGKAIRKIRIDRNLLLKDMADALEVSSPFLSSIETGKKQVPPDFLNRLCEYYNLDAGDCQKLRDAAAQSAKEIRIDIENLDDEKKGFVLAFAKRFENMNEIQRQRILDTLKTDEDEN